MSKQTSYDMFNVKDFKNENEPKDRINDYQIIAFDFDNTLSFGHIHNLLGSFENRFFELSYQQKKEIAHYILTAKKDISLEDFYKKFKSFLSPMTLKEFKTKATPTIVAKELANHGVNGNLKSLQESFGKLKTQPGLQIMILTFSRYPEAAEVFLELMDIDHSQAIIVYGQDFTSKTTSIAKDIHFNVGLLKLGAVISDIKAYAEDKEDLVAQARKRNIPSTLILQQHKLLPKEHEEHSESDEYSGSYESSDEELKKPFSFEKLNSALEEKPKHLEQFLQDLVRKLSELAKDSPSKKRNISGELKNPNAANMKEEVALSNEV